MMSRITKRFLLLLVCWGGFQTFLPAQASMGGQPYFFTQPALLESIILPAPDLTEVRAEDNRGPGTRFAVPIELTISPASHGQWMELPNGDRVWWLKLESQEAQGLAVFFQDFQLPRGARLFMFTEDGEQQYGAFTARNNPTTGRFMTGFTQGPTAVIEYYEPKHARGHDPFHIYRVDFAYEASSLLMFGFNTADTCEININCPLGTDWQAEKRGTCRILMVLAEGSGWCSGTLLNNTSQDQTPYILTAYHCQDTYTPLYDLWRFDFHYEAATCANPLEEPVFFSMLGSTEVAGRAASDFLLLEILNPIPASYNAYYNGWDRTASVPDTATILHHPSGDIKKISRDTQALVVHPFSIMWDNGVTTPANHHFKSILDQGTFEPGSSGGGVFNTDHRVVGQVHGGFFGCDQPLLYMGRFFQSWAAGPNPQERLSDWLDPLGNGQVTLDGLSPAGADRVSISGKVTTPVGTGMAGVSVVLSGAVDSTYLTEADGLYAFENLPLGEDYQLSFEKDYNADNGVTTLDMVGITKHILAVDPLDNPYQILAADANNNGQVSTLDLVYIKLVILILEDSFPNNTSWRFVPQDWEFSDPLDPFSDLPPPVYPFNNLLQDQAHFDMIGVKTGDVNNSANPNL